MVLKYLFNLCACVLSCFSHVQLFEMLWTVACQALLSMGFSQARILEWVAISSSRESSQLRIKPKSLMSPALAGGFFSTSATWEVPFNLWGKGKYRDKHACLYRNGKFLKG